MTFSHKTVNILFHIRKFPSAKDTLNTLCGSELSVQTFLKKHCIYIQSISQGLYHRATDINTEHLVLRNKNGVKYGVLYTRL